MIRSAARRWLRSRTLFAGFSPVSSQRHGLRFLLLVLDVVAVNLLFYLFLRSWVLSPLGFPPVVHVWLWGCLLVFVLYVSHGLLPWKSRPSGSHLFLHVFFFLAFAAAVVMLSHIEAVEKGTDWSWLRPEMIKVPLWLRMFVPMAPLFSVLFVAAVCVLMWLALTLPRSWTLRLLPTLAAAALVWKITVTFIPLAGPTVNEAASAGRGDLLPVYLVLFAGPLVLFSVLIWVRWFSMAFRLTPVAFHMTLIILNYMAVLPVHDIRDLVPFRAERGAAVRALPGVSVLYPPHGVEPDVSFIFLRKMALSGDALYMNYGPTCGMYAIDRRSGAARHLPMQGVMRDLRLAPDNRTVWGLNWLGGEFVALDTDPLGILCEQDLFDFGLTTPYNLLPDGDRVFISNVTYPIVAEFRWEDPDDPCSLRLVRSLDFYRAGFTRFTDGAYGMHLDEARNRIYAIVGPVGDRSLSAFLVEMDLETFRIERSILLRAGNPIFPVEGRNHVLVPSYYTAEVHEVSLPEMKVVRTLAAGPNVVSMEHDARRGLFYALCRAQGLLLVIEDESGRTVRKVPIGAKPEPLGFDRVTDELFVGSRLGVLRIDLERFLRDVAP